MTRRKDDTETQDCGCTHNGQRWLSECAKHKAENDALHARALAEHRGERQTARASIPDSSWLDIPD